MYNPRSWPGQALLEDEFAAIVVNAAHIKAVPGRKTDVKDAEWIAELLRHGLLRASFIPDRAQRELRELTRYRRSLVQERSREANRIQKLLEGANIKLSSVATDVLGVSGRAMLAALAAGEEDPEALADLARGQLRKKREELQEALRGLVQFHQRFMLASQLRHLEYLEAEVERLDEEVARRVAPFEDMVAAVDTIPGVGRRTAEVIAAEIGVNPAPFLTPGHLASWAGVCPSNKQSGEKRQRGPTRKGNGWLKPAPRFHEGRLWWRRLGPPDGPRPTWGLSTVGCPGASAPTGPPWQWPTPSPSSSTTSSRKGRLMWTWATITSKSGTGRPSPAGRCAGSKL